MNQTNWKIAEQSRRALAQALLSLMNQYDYKEITITQIAQEAGLSRKTFYRLFSDKDDILQFYFHGLFQQYAFQVNALQIRHYWDAVQLLFDFWEERRSLLSLLEKNNLLSRLFEQTYQYAGPIFEIIRSKETSESPAIAYLLAYSVGGIHSMLIKWAQNGMEVPSAQLIAALKAGFRSDML